MDILITDFISGIDFGEVQWGDRGRSFVTFKKLE